MRVLGLVYSKTGSNRLVVAGRTQPSRVKLETLRLGAAVATTASSTPSRTKAWPTLPGANPTPPSSVAGGPPATFSALPSPAHQPAGAVGIGVQAVGATRTVTSSDADSSPSVPVSRRTY